MQPEQTQISAFLKILFPFHKLNDQLLSEIIPILRMVEFKGGDKVFVQGAQAETHSLCIIYSGNVRLIRRGRKGIEEIGVLGPGEIFGYEALQDNFPHPVTAEVREAAIILQMDRRQFREILEKAPEIRSLIKIMMDSYQLRLNVPVYWRNPDEVIHLFARRHWFFLVKKLAFPVCLALAALPVLFSASKILPENAYTVGILIFLYLVTFGAWIVWQALDWTNDFAIITSQRVLAQEKVLILYESRQEAPLTAVLSVAVKTGQVGRMLNFGDVVVRTYAGSILLSGLPNPQQIAAYLELQWGRTKSDHATMEKAALEDAVRLRLGIPLKNQPLPDPSLPAPITVAPGRILSAQEKLADLFKLRDTNNGEVMYRMHWIILLRKIFLPTILFLSVWVSFFTFAAGRMSGTFLNITMILTFLMTFASGFWWVYQVMDWRDDYYIISSEQILDVYKKPLGKEEIRTAPLKNVQSVNFERIGLLGLLLNYGTVTIMVGEAKLTFNNVYNPSDIQRELFKRLAEREYIDKKTKLEEDQKWMGDWISAYHRVMQDHQQTTPPDTDAGMR